MVLYYANVKTVRFQKLNNKTGNIMYNYSEKQEKMQQLFYKF